MLVDPCVLGYFELELMTLDLPVWPVSTAPIYTDAPRMAFQIRHRLLMKHRGEWDLASGWTPVWIGFGPTWRNGDEPLPWAAHAALWDALDSYAEHVRYHRRLGGIPRLSLPKDVHP